jgi:hypothetical protein
VPDQVLVAVVGAVVVVVVAVVGAVVVVVVVVVVAVVVVAVVVVGFAHVRRPRDGALSDGGADTPSRSDRARPFGAI